MENKTNPEMAPEYESCDIGVFEKILDEDGVAADDPARLDFLASFRYCTESPAYDSGCETKFIGRIRKGDPMAGIELAADKFLLAAGITRQYAGKGVPFLTLLTEGFYAVVKAAEKFDCGGERSFDDCAAEEIHRSSAGLINRYADDPYCSEQLVKELSRRLTPREVEIIKLRFGLEDGRTRTLEEVGKEFNITRERIRQIEAKALRKLRHQSRSKILKGFLNDMT